MTEPRDIFVVVNFNQWDGLMADGQQVKASAMLGVGYLPVFYTRWEAKRLYPESEILEGVMTVKEPADAQAE